MKSGTPEAVGIMQQICLHRFSRAGAYRNTNLGSPQVESASGSLGEISPWSSTLAVKHLLALHAHLHKQPRNNRDLTLRFPSANRALVMRWWKT
jgi:hypothetical protein